MIIALQRACHPRGPKLVVGQQAKEASQILWEF